jgi:hypothetical protein
MAKKKIKYDKVMRVRKDIRLDKAYLLRMPSDLYNKVKKQSKKDGVTISATLLAVITEAF